jgi:hypothetical protein
VVPTESGHHRQTDACNQWEQFIMICTFLHKVGKINKTGSFQSFEKLYCRQSYDLRSVMCGMRGRYAYVPTLRRKLMT